MLLRASDNLYLYLNVRQIILRVTHTVERWVFNHIALVFIIILVYSPAFFCWKFIFERFWMVRVHRHRCHMPSPVHTRARHENMYVYMHDKMTMIRMMKEIRSIFVSFPLSFWLLLYNVPVCVCVRALSRFGRSFILFVVGNSLLSSFSFFNVWQKENILFTTSHYNEFMTGYFLYIHISMCVYECLYSSLAYIENATFFHSFSSFRCAFPHP